MSKKDVLNTIIANVGGKGNILNVWHCMTRLRFSLKNYSLINTENIEQLDGVIGINRKEDQFQIVIGTNVDEYYTELTDILGIAQQPQVPEDDIPEKKSFISWFMDVVSGVFGPIVPAIAGAGMLKGIISGLVALELINGQSDTVLVIDMIASGVFTFLPFFTAVSAAKKFKTNEYLAVALAAALMFPTMVDAAKAGEITNFYPFGFIPVRVFNYSGSIIPIILSVLALSYIYRWVDSKIPKYMRAVVTPFLALFITGFLSLTIIGPAGVYLGKGLAWIIDGLFNISPIFAGIIVGAIRPIAILTGMHHAMTPIALENFATKGWDMLMPMMFVANLSITGATLAIYFKKNQTENEKQIAFSAVVSGFLGITEPALFGVLTKHKKSFIAATLGSTIGSALIGLFGVKLYGYILSSVFSIPAYIGPHFVYAIICWIVAFVSSFFLSYYFVMKED
ncbi:PTS transporter subunit EIIC [Streptococcus merionis]|uniref:PTS system protein n=1 Tax=Streptococcus merionis TaxID=400065 RepID=A0A239SUT0_9STRE|nr:PTS transporter subunit EIIC [Streptococcus merionis]SNU89251.1 PTS system protein [Streptococcus merionis]